METYTFVRKRLGGKVESTPVGANYMSYSAHDRPNYGPYLYRETTTGRFLASWDKPIPGQTVYKGEDIGCLSDAVYYYKNE